MSKRLKDPIYGYITIDDKIIKEIVDTAEFQRLRNVVQTSYEPLYSSAVHNRFVHSLGVYYLGTLVAENIKGVVEKELKDTEYERCIEVFLLACLLHDVGHAPFSHTGEEYYLKSGERVELHKRLSELTGDSNLEEEISQKSYKAAPHELMSAIVAIECFGNIIGGDKEKSFFARCITGYQYAMDEDEKYKILNCVISLLNSSVIDVDKLDYLIRDAYITGFDTINIDYERLLRSIYIKKDLVKREADYEVVYTKGAISVIENVVYAHDAERKWIQNHPVVQYEGFLIKRIIDDLNEKYGDNVLFSEEALSKEGRMIKGENVRVSLLCDADIIFLMKNLYDNKYVEEYLDRGKRRHPLWKSEAEYRALFGTCFSTQTYEVLEQEMVALLKYLNFIQHSNIINEASLKACEEDIQAAEKLYEESGSDKKFRKQVEDKKEYKCWMEAFKEFADKQGIDFDFVLLEETLFSSGFAKERLSELKVEFSDLKSLSRLGEISTVLSSRSAERDKFFYVFYRRDDKKNIRMIELVNILDYLVRNKVQ